MKYAVIPARGGSKRIPRKNIRLFLGKPLIAYSIEAAQRSKLFEKVIVSTEDEEIAKVAEAWGAEVPFLRPPQLADDYTGTGDVIAHATTWMCRQGWTPGLVCCIYPTAPLMSTADLERGCTEMASGEWDYAFSVVEFPAPIFRAFRQSVSGGVEMYFPEQYGSRSQDLAMAFHDAGQFYWGRVDAWMSLRRVFSSTSRPVVVPRWRAQDIDTEEDWKMAEYLYKAVSMVDEASPPSSPGERETVDAWKGV